ncbi:hypothetical protein PInf_005096 [Phytophthora infestans]|nr:hypothetical protein PInf_005096 [Phytophthora infestans]
MLRFEAQTRAGAYAADIVDSMNTVLREAQRRGIGGSGMIPKWFIPSYQVKLEEKLEVEGNLPTFASDIYAFGMCIIEAVTGDFPWGRNLADQAVTRLVKTEKKISDRPAVFKDKEWNLVERMCRWDPQKRIGIGSVIKMLEDIGVSNLIEAGGNVGPTTVTAKTPN